MANSEMKRRKDKGSGAVLPIPPQVTIRVLEKADCKQVHDLVHQLLYVEAAKSLGLEAVQNMSFLAVNVISCILLYMVTGSMYVANICFFTWPCVGYMYITYKMAEREYNKGEDTRAEADMFEYWVQPGRLQLVAEVNHKIVGAIAMIDISTDHCVIIRIVTDPWIKQFDIRERLIRMLIVLGRDRDIKQLDFVTSYPNRHRSFHDLYESLGFDLQDIVSKGILPFFKVKRYNYCYRFSHDASPEEKLLAIDDLDE